jgi:hypothetical protein
MWRFASALLATFAVSLVLAAPVAAQDRYSSITVDTAPLAAYGAPGAAAFLRRALESDLRQTFADKLGAPRSGPRLVVRMTSITLSSNVFNGAIATRRGSRLRGTGDLPEADYLEGEALVVGRNGAILSRTPMLARLDANSGGVWNAPDNEARRLKALSYQYAWWLRRQVQ